MACVKENAIVCLRIVFDIHKNFRSAGVIGPQHGPLPLHASPASSSDAVLCSPSLAEDVQAFISFLLRQYGWEGLGLRGRESMSAA